MNALLSIIVIVAYHYYHRPLSLRDRARTAQNTASQLERTINRWAGEVLRLAPAPAAALQDAALADLAGAGESALFTDVRPMMVQSLMRHAMAECISDGIINCLIVTSSAEANVQLTRIHEHLFARKCLIIVLIKILGLESLLRFLSRCPRCPRCFHFHPSLSRPLTNHPLPHPVPSHHPSKSAENEVLMNFLVCPFLGIRSQEIRPWQPAGGAKRSPPP